MGLKSRHNSSLIRNLDEDDVKHFIASYNAGKFAREQLISSIVEKISSADIENENPKRLQSQNYVLDLADSFGYKRALREVIALLDQELENE